MKNLMLLVMGAFLVSSCLDDDDNNNNGNTITSPVSTGAFVLNKGADGAADGSLTYLDFETMAARQIEGIGAGPNDAYTKGDTIFIVNSSDNSIVVVDKKFSVIKRLSTTSEMGEAEGFCPRHITGYGNRIYFTTYGGYVGILDAKSLEISKEKYKVGSGPEGLCISGTSTEPVLYVCNSDYGNGNASISRVSLSAAGGVETITSDEIRNPQEIIAEGGSLYILDGGHYTDENSLPQDAGLYRYYNGSVTQLIADATNLGVGLVYMNGYAVGYYFVTINAPDENSDYSYSTFNTYTGSRGTLRLTEDSGYEIFSPAAIAVDPITGNIAIASYSKDPETGLASKTLPGYVNMYGSSGMYIEDSHIQTGIMPSFIGFILGTITYTF